jgi:nucleoside-diphosphate-sugar epimerase
MVNILVLGGTGATGQALIEEAIARKHTVVVFARSPEKLPEELKSHPSVVIVAGTLEDEEAIKTAFTAHRSTGPETPGQSQVQQESTSENLTSTRIHIDAIISALGPPVKKIHPSGHPIAKGYERIVRIGKEYGVSRFVVLGTASIPDSEDRFDTRFKALVLASVSTRSGG